MATIRARGKKYQVQIRRQGQCNLSKSFALRKDAEAWARQIEVQADKNELPVDASVLKSLTLGDLVVRYRDTVSPRKKNRAWEEIVLNAFLRHSICTKSISKLTSADFAAYRDDRLQSITAKSLRRLLCPIHNMFEIARNEWGLPIQENPLDKVKLKSIDNRRERRLREGELERIIEASKATKNAYILPIILFALETAMRRGRSFPLPGTA